MKTSNGADPVNILFLAANPLDEDRVRLALDEEFRAIRAKVRAAQHRDRFTVESEWAVRLGDLSDALLRHRPQVVHFSGHGEESGAVILAEASEQSKAVPPDTLAGLFRVLKDDVRVVVLNACYSEAQAQAIVREVDCAVGISGEVADQHAVAFAEEFYQALANGRSVQKAFDLGVWRLKNIDVPPPDGLVKLHERIGIKASDIILVAHPSEGPEAVVVPVRLLQHRDRRTINFQGREKELDELTAEVRAAVTNGTSLSFVGIKGMGGLGKTALAAELAERLARDFPGGVLWANLQEEAPAEAARRWLRDLRQDERDLGPDECLRRFRQMAGDIRPLIVLDNVPRPSARENLAEPLLVKAPGVATLLTTRFRESVPAGVRVQSLDVLPHDEALALLRTHLGPAVDSDPAAEPVMQLCERLPLFLNVAGRAVANGYYDLAGYAEELRGRGLAALAEEDETGRAAVLFDLSWDHLPPQAKEVFAVLALSPGEDVGPNLVQAWLGTSGGKAGRLLTELANASLLTAAPSRPGRYRYHDRVRDYARGRLPLPDDEVRRRLLRCWTDWYMVKAEFEAVGAGGLAGQYQHLRAWGVEELPDFAPWYHFVRAQAPVLGLYPELFFQQAFNEPADSPVSLATRSRLGTLEEPERWLEWVNRPREWAAPACVMVLRGHTEGVYGVAVTADGRTAVSGGGDSTVRVWDLTGGRCTILEGHTGTVLTVAVTADGRTAVSGSGDNTVRVWDLIGGRCTVLEGHTGKVISVAVTADGRRAVSGAEDNTVRVWDVANGRCIALEGYREWVRSVAVTADGWSVVSELDDHTVRVRDMASRRCTRLEGHTDWVRRVAMTADGRSAVSGSDDKTVLVWDLVSGRCTALEGHTDRVRGVAVTADGQTAVSAADKTVRVWDAAGGCAHLEGHTGEVSSVAVTANGRTAVSGAWDNTVRVWDLAGGRCTTLEGHTEKVSSVAVTADGRLAVTGSHDWTVRVWDLVGGRCTPLEGHTGEIWRVAVTADGRTAISGSHDTTVRVWDLASGRCTASHDYLSEESYRTWASSDRRHPSTTDIKGHDLTVRATDDGAVLLRFPGTFTAADCSADGRNVIAGDGRGGVYILKMHTRGG